MVAATPAAGVVGADGVGTMGAGGGGARANEGGAADGGEVEWVADRLVDTGECVCVLGGHG